LNEATRRLIEPRASAGVVGTVASKPVTRLAVSMQSVFFIVDALPSIRWTHAEGCVRGASGTAPTDPSRQPARERLSVTVRQVRDLPWQNGLIHQEAGPIRIAT
jgi:hypothetical protein